MTSQELQDLLLCYRVSHSDMVFLKWFWGVEMLRILMTYLWPHGHEGYPFVFHHPVFKHVASAGLNSLRQNGYQILVKKLDFWWSIPQKGTIIGHFGARNDPTIRISNFFWWNEAVEVMEAAEVPRPGKSQLGTSESSRFLNSALFWFFLKSIFVIESWNIKLNFSTFSVRGCGGQPMLLFWKTVVVCEIPYLSIPESSLNQI